MVEVRKCLMGVGVMVVEWWDVGEKGGEVVWGKWERVEGKGEVVM